MLKRFVAAAAMAVLVPVGAKAADVPLNQIMLGTMKNNVVTVKSQYQCYVPLGPSALKKRSTGINGVEEIEFQYAVDSDYSAANQAYVWQGYVGGLGIFKFLTATSGDVHFDFEFNEGGTTSLPPLTQLTFTDYAETYAAGILTVKFTLQMPDCALPITATYRSN